MKWIGYSMQFDQRFEQIKKPLLPMFATGLKNKVNLAE